MVMQFQMMDRTRIQPSPLNPRKHFDAPKLEELAASMANGVGIIEPLVVRPRPDLNCYELIAGERRWRASEIAGLAQVPVVVKELTDAQVIEQMLIENGQREDINPLEEGQGFKLALSLGTFADVTALAAHVGKSRRYVYDHLKLVDDLVPEAKTLLAQGEISGSHGVILSRLTPAQQAEALDPDHGGLFEEDWDDADTDADIVPTKPRSVREFEAWVTKRYRFDPTSRDARERFPETAAAVAAAATVVEITHESGFNVPAGDGHDRILAHGRWHRADGRQDSIACDRAVIGVVVLGRGRGEAFPVCVDTQCKIHWPAQPRQPRGKAAPKMVWAKSGAYVEAGELADENKRWEQQQERERAARVAWVSAVPRIIAACAVRVRKVKPAVLVDVVLEAGDGLDRDLLDEAAGMLPKKQDEATMLQALGLATLIGMCGNEYYGPRRFPAIAERIGVDVTSLLQPVQTSAAPAKTAKAKVNVKAAAKAAATTAKKAKAS